MIELVIVEGDRLTFNVGVAQVSSDVVHRYTHPQRGLSSVYVRTEVISVSEIIC